MASLIPTHINHPSLPYFSYHQSSLSQQGTWLPSPYTWGMWKPAQCYCQPKFMDLKVDRGGIESRHFRPLVLASGMPESKRAILKPSFLSSVANVLERFPTPLPFLGNTFISQLSPWLPQSARPNRRPQCTHTDKSSRLTHKEIPCDKAALGGAILICKDLFSLVGRRWSFIWTVMWWGGIQTSIKNSAEIQPSFERQEKPGLTSAHQAPLQHPTQPLLTICCALWTGKSIFW